MPCLSIEQLQRFVNGELSDSDRENFERHVATCASCGNQIASMTKDLDLAEEIRAVKTSELDGCTTITQDAASGGGSELDIPERIGPVKLIREIGRGGMGVVWLGRHELLGRDVAIKFLTRAKPGTDDPSYAKLLDGARAAASVRHPNLTLIYDADLFEHVPYLVLEYVDGADLSQIGAAGGGFDLSVCLALMDLASAAVAELHKHNIVHRDIKPSNVMLDVDGHVFVTDFGLACPRPFGDIGRVSEAVAGTPSYMAPEMFDGAVSARSDVYALGIMMFQLLTGKRPFTGNLDEIRNGHVNEPLPIQWLTEQGLDAALIEVIERATNKQAMYRHKTADHFRQALREAVRDAGVTLAGPAELQSLAMRQRTSVEAPQPAPADKTPSSSYYDAISESAAVKRRDRKTTPKGSPEPTERPLIMSENEVVPVDLPCIHCRYNLRGVPITERCPECGVPIAESSRPDRLLFADQDWLRRVTRGLRLAHLLPFGILPTLLFVPLAGSLVSIIFFFLPPPDLKWGRAIAFMVMLTLPPLIASIGAWLALSPEPATIAEPDRERKRRRARQSIALTWASVALTALSFLGIRWGEYAAMFIAASIMLAAVSAGHSLTYLLRQAHRVGKLAKFRRKSRLCAIVCIVPPVLVVVLSPLDWLLPTIFLGLLLTFLSTMRLFRDYAVEFRQAAREHVPYPAILDQCRAADGGTGTNTAENVLHTARPETREAGTLQADVPCAGCDYNLRGLPNTRDACPECGKALHESLYRDRLMFADRALLQRIRKGLVVMEVGLASLLLGVLSIMLTGWKLPLLLGGGCLVGTVIATGILVARPANARAFLIMASAVLTLTVINGVMTAAMVSGMTAESAAAAWVRPLAPWSYSLAVIALIVAVAVFLRWLRSLLLRVPDARLAKKAGQCAWQLPVFAVLFPLTWPMMLSALSDGQEVWTIRLMLGFGSLVSGLLLFAVLSGVWDVLRRGRRAVSAALGRQVDFDELYLEDLIDHRPSVSPARPPAAPSVCARVVDRSESTEGSSET